MTPTMNKRVVELKALLEQRAFEKGIKLNQLKDDVLHAFCDRHKAAPGPLFVRLEEIAMRNSDGSMPSQAALRVQAIEEWAESEKAGTS